MDPVNVEDMAAPSLHTHRLSQISSSTMDDDYLSDLHQKSLSGHESPLSDDASEHESSIHVDCSYLKGIEAKEEKSFSQDLGAGKASSVVGNLEGDTSATNQLEHLPPLYSSSSMSNPARPPRDDVDQLIREAEQIVLKQSLEVLNSIPGASSSQSLYSFAFDREQLDDPRGIIERSIPDEEKKTKISALFARAASNGDLNRIVDILDNFREWVDINAHEEDGSTPLIYAACFGQTAAVFMLLDAGALVDERDKFGWTALVWATNNKHEDIVRMLLEHGASPTAQTAKGRTVEDFLRHDPNDTTKIAQIFQEPSTQAIIAAEKKLSTRITALQMNSNQHQREVMTENDRQHGVNMNHRQSPTNTNISESDCTLADQLQEEEEDDDDDEEIREFDWEKCLLDQMFVFSSKDIPHIIETVITNMKPTEPSQTKPHEPIPAYVIFLAARFAQNFSTPDLVDELLDAAITAIKSTTKNKSEDMTSCAFWISNVSALAYFLQKDAGLRTTFELYDAKLESLVFSIAKIIILEAEKQIEQVIQTAMLENDTIGGMDEVKFQSDWAFRFWRGRGGKNNNKRNSAPPAPPSRSPSQRSSTRLSLQFQRPVVPQQFSTSPKDVTTVLSSVLDVMQAYDIHPEIVHYAVAQLFYYVSSEVFNRMMNNRKFLSRSKALQTRLNISILEDWLRNNKLPSRLADQISPLVQLLQLLQVLSQQDDLTTWIETRRKVELLNPVHVKHVVSLYRYEVNEERLPTEVTKYVMQEVADAEKVRRQSIERRRESLSVACSEISSRRNSSQRSSIDEISGSSADDDDMEDDTLTIVPRSRTFSQETVIQVEEEDDISPSTTKDSKTWIHFVMPVNLAVRDGGVERTYVPEIPEEIMTLLDNVL
ncbi:hypothetical protein BGZ76_002057 [Entomortierella beljakovae]|nr:hypothetical protein BGZ76_002057 [Entomortierella beljakovae]